MSQTQSNINAAYINKLNKVKVLACIRSHGRTSRADIVRETGLSAPTVTRIVDSLIHDEKLAIEIGRGDSVGGRPPVMVEFQGRENFVVGIDLGATNIRGVLSDLDANIQQEISIPTELDSGFDRIVERVSGVIQQLLDLARDSGNEARGIGLAIAGLINTQENMVEFSPDFSWERADIHGALAERFDLPIVFDNVTRVMALGELWYGIGETYDHFVCVNVGYGIGSGIVIGRKPFFGSEGMAGEFGHITADRDSTVQCECGNYGCLEALASGRGIAEAARRALEEGRESRLKQMCRGDVDTVTSKMVGQAADAGDSLARELIANAAELIGVGIAGVVNLFNPQAVIIGGGVVQSGPLFLDTIRETVKQRALPHHAETVEILRVTHANNATVMGAVALVLNEVLALRTQSAVA